MNVISLAIIGGLVLIDQYELLVLYIIIKGIGVCRDVIEEARYGEKAK